MLSWYLCLSPVHSLLLVPALQKKKEAEELSVEVADLFRNVLRLHLKMNRTKRSRATRSSGTAADQLGSEAEDEMQEAAELTELDPVQLSYWIAHTFTVSDSFALQQLPCFSPQQRPYSLTYQLTLYTPGVAVLSFYPLCVVTQVTASALLLPCSSAALHRVSLSFCECTLLRNKGQLLSSAQALAAGCTSACSAAKDGSSVERLGFSKASRWHAYAANSLPDRLRAAS